jgi:hypothetical protein
MIAAVDIPIGIVMFLFGTFNRLMIYELGRGFSIISATVDTVRGSCCC